MLPFNPTALVGLSIGAAALSGMAYMKGRADGRAIAVTYGERFVAILSNEQQACRADKAVLISQIGWERQGKREQIEACLEGMAATGAARARMEQALREERSRVREAEREATEILQRLAEAQDAWKENPIPDSIVCGVLRGRGCPAPSVRDPATSANPGADVDIRSDSAGGDGVDAVPGN